MPPVFSEGALRETAYRPGLDRVQEAVISSHFMEVFCGDRHLDLYGDEEFADRTRFISRDTFRNTLLPALRRASLDFGESRARAAERRARMGQQRPDREAEVNESITEVIFDRQFRKGPCSLSRERVRAHVARCVASGRPLEMVIPALPYKLSSPLKSRGPQPDLSEAGFMLELFEITTAVDRLYRQVAPGASGPLAKFTVVCDGSRFRRIVNESDEVVHQYKEALRELIGALGLEEHIELADYQELVTSRFGTEHRELKKQLRESARTRYSEAMWKLFDPTDMQGTLRAAAAADPDPESSNAEGRFVSLFKSLVYTVRYRCLDPHRCAGDYQALYRELTRHLLDGEPHARRHPTTEGIDPAAVDGADSSSLPRSERSRLRRQMLEEAWAATIDYIAEIKSDRDQSSDPIASCFPGHLRWTIHAKPGQLGLLTPHALGRPVQAWAGTAVFKRVGEAKVRLCTLPVLALEGVGSVPVVTQSPDDDVSSVRQPLFYLYPDVEFETADEFATRLSNRLVRRRAK